jgi:L-amino acid N-acyltransferase YncA
MSLDTASMARLLNQIIDAGGTTALTRPVTACDLTEWMRFEPERAAWHVALDGTERVTGFQWIEPDERLPAEAANIATFVQMGQTGLGIGSALFDATRAAAKSLGYIWINATIRADNTGGLTYYQSRGFRDYAIEENVRLESGLVVDKISKRFDL